MINLIKGDESMENVFSQQLVKLRRRQNLSQEQLAHELFVSRQSISKWEQGETSPDLDTVVKLANLLQVDLNELVGGQAAEAKEQSYKAVKTLPEGQRPMNGWEFLSKNWWMIFPLLVALSWVVGMFQH
ncbi:helix-turn-helix domain-containing protein [Levilactobacillus parabrevis]|uniref:helix-turn-helix domain-containing protein n=2 Tax=Levilactobacillus parabrevis TaxID=357278 RepID=UPI00375696B3